jgi:hypothetical protein
MFNFFSNNNNLTNKLIDEKDQSEQLDKYNLFNNNPDYKKLHSANPMNNHSDNPMNNHSDNPMNNHSDNPMNNFVNSNDSNNLSKNQIDMLKNKVNKLKEKSIENILLITENTDKINELHDRAEILQLNSNDFHKITTKINRKLMCDKIKFRSCILLIIVIVVTLIIFLCIFINKNN